jgi:hypothetical protein
MSRRPNRLNANRLSAKLLKLTPFASLALLFAAAAAPLRAQAQDKAAKLDKKVVELCKQAGDLYKNAKSLHTEGTFVTKIDNNGQKREINVTVVYEIERPNRLSLKTQLDGDAKKGPDVVSDGKKLTLYRKALKQYTQEDAPKDLSEFSGRLPQAGPLAAGMLFPNILTDDPAGSLMEGVNSCSYVGIDKVDGTPAHHMKFSQDQFDWEMWVASEGKPFVLRMTRSVDGDNGRSRRRRLTRIGRPTRRSNQKYSRFPLRRTPPRSTNSRSDKPRRRRVELFAAGTEGDACHRRLVRQCSSFQRANKNSGGRP